MTEQKRRLVESKVLSFCVWYESGGMRKGVESKICFCHARGLRDSTKTYCERGKFVCGVFVDD